MSLMLAIKVHAVALSEVCSQSFASLRQRPSQAKVRSTTHRRGSTSKPLAVSDRLMISMVHIAEHRDFWRECVVKAAKFHYNYRDPDEQVEYKIRPATPEKPSAEQQRANDWDEWLLTEQPPDEEATRKLARKDEAEKKEKAQREYDREQIRITKKRKQDAHARSTCTLLHLPTLTGQT